MDEITISVGASPRSEDPTQVLISISGRSLFELVRQVELPFAEAEGAPGIAGAYAGLPSAEVLPPSKHLLGEVDEIYRYDERIQILGCDCGEPGCWPLVCKIDVMPDTIVWSSFQQPHRSEAWSLDALGPFTFGRAQYEQALLAAADASNGS